MPCMIYARIRTLACVFASSFPPCFWTSILTNETGTNRGVLGNRGGVKGAEALGQAQR